MKDTTHKIDAFILKNIKNHPNDIVLVVSKHFSVSRTTAHRHLNALVSDGKIIKTGITNKVIYSLNNTKEKTLTFKIDGKTTEDDVWNKYLKEDFKPLNKNVYDICQYGFTEIFNNAIEHSEGRSVNVSVERTNRSIKMLIADDGIGIFRKIKNTLKLEDIREGALHLSKGKFTTDQKHHSGEGIFFTSRAFDEFHLLSNNVSYIRKNEKDEHDWFIDTLKEPKDGLGTIVRMMIDIQSPRKLDDIFKEYSSNDETYRFNKTNIIVALSNFGEEQYVSRSQAKRILLGLDKFEKIILDFEGVKTVGQGFVDEVFRVFKHEHPNIEIEYVNANDNVLFMIKRGINTLR